MIRNIVSSRIFLMRPSKKATPYDAPLGKDLLETLSAHRPECLGMAANMIGVSKRIIAFVDKGVPTLMYNPQILERYEEYQTTESCLSLPMETEVTRYKRIKVKFQDESFKWHERMYEGLTAEIIQHEVDHCEGILV